MTKRIRRRFTGSDKTQVVKRHLVDKVAVSDLCEELGLQPTQFNQWQKQLFQNGTRAFKSTGKTGSDTMLADLEVKLTRRNAIVSELLEGCLGCCLQKTEHRERLAGSRGRQ